MRFSIIVITLNAIAYKTIFFFVLYKDIEVKELFQSIVVEWFDKSIDSDNYRLLLESLIAGEMQDFESQLMRKAEPYQDENIVSICKSIGAQKVAFIRHQGVRKVSKIVAIIHYFF